MNEAMLAQVSGGKGFFAALDQSGGSTPGALHAYGISDSVYRNDDEMFALMHAMRVRIMTAPAFTAPRIIAAILFERTIDGEVEHRPVPAYLWEERGIVPFLKIDQGLDCERDGVQLMKPMPALDVLLMRAAKLGIFGTKMRSVIAQPSKEGIAAIVAQQFELATRILRHGLMPIIEPEVLLASRDKAAVETLLYDELSRHLDALTLGQNVILKLAIPDVPNLYQALVGHDRIARILALSGGYSRDDACVRLAMNAGMIASFSRAFIEDLLLPMDTAEFNTMLATSIDKIYWASIVKPGSLQPVSH